jgi:transposase
MDIVIVGIDIAKLKFDVALRNAKDHWISHTFNNNASGYELFCTWLSKKDIPMAHAVMEATARYGENLATYLYGKGFTVSIVNPAQIKYYSQSLLTRAKTDRADARLIADFAKQRMLKAWQPLSVSAQKFRELFRCLDNFKNDETRQKNRLEQAKDEDVRTFYQERLDHVMTQIVSVEEKLRKLVEGDKTLKTNIALLDSIVGIGETTAWALCAELPDISSFETPKQMVAHVGLNPSVRQSGTSVKGRGSISKTGSSLLRKQLFFPAMSAIRYNPVVKVFAERLRGNGKVGKVLVVACMRKLLDIVFGVLKKQKVFQK